MFCFLVFFCTDDLFFLPGEARAGQLPPDAGAAPKGVPSGDFVMFFLLFLGPVVFCLLWVGGFPLLRVCPPVFFLFWVVGLGVSPVCSLASCLSFLHLG